MGIAIGALRARRSRMKRQKSKYRNIVVVLVGAAVIWGCGAEKSSLAQGQNPTSAPIVQTVPATRTTAGSNASGTITATGTFQNVFGASPVRTGCLIENNGAASMWVSEGVPVATPPTEAKSQVLAAGASFSCERNGGSVLTGEIDITGTATQVFYAVQY